MNEDNVIDFVAKKAEKKRKAEILLAIKDTIYMHGKLFVSGAPREVADKVRYGINKQGYKYVGKLMDKMFEIASEGRVGYKMLYLMYKKYGEEVWPTREEELGAFLKGIEEVLEEEHPPPPPYGSHLKIVDNE